jgi:RHS repeat-associated protein
LASLRAHLNNFAGEARLAVRTGGTLSYLLGDHLGSSSVTTDANGVKTASALYKAFGETRYTLGNLGTDYHFTGQREESALGGIYWFQSRWFDPTLGRFMSPDTIVPTGTQGTQAWDRYAFVNNNPVRYTDPTGHRTCEEDGYNCEGDDYVSPTPTPTPTATATPSTIETAISYLQYSPIGLMLYNMMMGQGFTIEYGAPGSGGSLNETDKIIYVSPDYSPTYIAGTIAHEAMHYQVSESDMLPRLEEYRALLVGDAVRAQIVSAGYGTSSVLRNPLSSYTVDINIADPVELQAALNVWFKLNEGY